MVRFPPLPSWVDRANKYRSGGAVHEVMGAIRHFLLVRRCIGGLRNRNPIEERGFLFQPAGPPLFPLSTARARKPHPGRDISGLRQEYKNRH